MTSVNHCGEPHIDGLICIECSANLAALGARSVPVGLGPDGQTFRCAPGYGCADRGAVAEREAEADIAAARRVLEVEDGATVRYCRPSISGVPVSGSAVVDCRRILDTKEVIYEAEDEDTGEVLMLRDEDIVKVLGRDEYASAPSEIDFRVSSRVVSAMASGGVTVRALAERIGMAPERVADLLDGRASWPVTAVFSASETIGLRASELVDGGRNDEPDTDADEAAGHAVRCARCGEPVAWSPYPVVAAVYCGAHAGSGTDQRVRPVFAHDELAAVVERAGEE